MFSGRGGRQRLRDLERGSGLGRRWPPTGGRPLGNYSGDLKVTSLGKIMFRFPLRRAGEPSMARVDLSIYIIDFNYSDIRFFTLCGFCVSANICSVSNDIKNNNGLK